VAAGSPIRICANERIIVDGGAMTAKRLLRTHAVLLIAIVVSICQPAQAQPATQFPPRAPSPSYDLVAPPPLTPADMVNYCVYDNRVYSLGAGVCVGRTPYVCVPSPGPSTGNRAYWAGREDQVFLRPVCN
jgi:Protein of unknown function (DUF1496)